MMIYMTVTVILLALVTIVATVADWIDQQTSRRRHYQRALNEVTSAVRQNKELQDAVHTDTWNAYFKN